MHIAIDLTDCSASERSNIGLNYATCFWAKCEEPRICQTEKIAQMRRVFL